MENSKDIEYKSLLKDLWETIRANEENILNLPASGETEDIDEEHPPVVPAYYPAVACDLLLGEAKGLKDRGDEFWKNNKWHTALECYTEGLKLQEHRALYFNRGLCYFNLEKYEESVSDCTDALRLDVKYGKAYFKRGKAREKLGDFYGACIDFQSALICSRFNSRAAWEAFTRIKLRALDDFYSKINITDGRNRYDLASETVDGGEHCASPRRVIQNKQPLKLKYSFPEAHKSDITGQVVVGRSPSEAVQPYRLSVSKVLGNTERDELFEEAVTALVGPGESVKSVGVS